MTSLSALRDLARPLLIFAPTLDDPRLVRQCRAVQEHAAEARDRDLVAIALPYRTGRATGAHLAPDEAKAVRRRFHVRPDEFAVILIGKDGGAKLRSPELLPIDKLMETIDAMPMRQGEMRAKVPG